jgi:hypothetical protein
MPAAKIGDVLEIRTNSGLAYALLTHVHEGKPRFGALIRVFERLYATRPEDFQKVVADDIRFSIFFPVQAAVKEGIVEIVAQVIVPQHLKPFPVFRTGMVDPQSKKVAAWWLWDGTSEHRIGTLSAEQRKLSIRGVWNDTLLVDRIVSGWRPENDMS